jgi:hypothetical protein
MIATIALLVLAFVITVGFTATEIWLSFSADSAWSFSPGWELACL